MASRLPVGTWILCFIVVCGVAGSAHAVDRLVPQEYPTIQEGINAAQTGDIVLVSPGVYNELIDFLGKTITVRSTDGPAVTIIDGGGSGPIVTFQNLEGPGSVLEGFTITNGVAAEGAGITILDAYPTILNNTISGNTATTGPGGGIMMRNYTPNIDASLIPRIAGNIIRQNLSVNSDGGGVYAYSNYDFPEFSGNQWEENQAAAMGTTLLVRNNSGNSGGLILEEEVVKGSDSLNPGTSGSGQSTIKIEGVDVELTRSRLEIKNSSGWANGFYVNNDSTLINDTDFILTESGSTNGYKLAYIKSQHLLLNNVSTKNESSSTSGVFDTHIGFTNDSAASLTSYNFSSENVTPIFYTGYATGMTTKLTNTSIRDAPITIAHVNNYSEGTIEVNQLNLSGSIGSWWSPIGISTRNYEYETPTKINLSYVSIKNADLTAGETIIGTRFEGPSKTVGLFENIEISDLQLSNSTFEHAFSLYAENYYYGEDRENEFSFRNILIESPTVTSSAFALVTTENYDSQYYGFAGQTRFNLSNITLTDPNSGFPTLSLDQTGGYFLPTFIDITDSIILGQVPLEVSPDTFTELTVSTSLTPVSTPGENNITGLPEFASGNNDGFFLAQVATGNQSDSLGVDSGNPSLSVTDNVGTRSDGGLDTGVPDIGFRRPTKSITSDYELVISNPVMRHESQTGLIDNSTVTLSLLHLGELGPASEFRGISLRILQEAAHLQLQSAMVSDELVNMLGQAPEYFEVTSCGDIITLGMIPSLSDNQLGFTLDTPLEVFELNFGAGTSLIGQQSVIETQLIPSDGPGCGTLDVQCLLTDANGETTLLSYQPARITLVPYGLFRRIDANSDGLSNIGDAIFILGFLFNFATPPSCDDAADVNDDGSIDIGDGVYLLASLFTNGAPPPLPGLICGPDTTADDLRCQNPEPCSESVQIQNLTVTAIPNPVGGTGSSNDWEITWNESGPVDHVQLLIDDRVLARLPAGLGAYILSADEASSGSVCIRIIGQDSVATDCAELP